jgi:hypothetical protein
MSTLYCQVQNYGVVLLSIGACPWPLPNGACCLLVCACDQRTMFSAPPPARRAKPAVDSPSSPCLDLPCPALSLRMPRPAPRCSSHALPCPALPCPALPCHALICPAPRCSSHALCPPAMPRPALPCPAPPRPARPVTLYAPPRPVSCRRPTAADLMCAHSWGTCSQGPEPAGGPRRRPEPPYATRSPQPEAAADLDTEGLHADLCSLQ